jgi:2-polyprenyl-6-methoxyphenol hydroxylase-like FAD-dependent oxidoreductase
MKEIRTEVLVVGAGPTGLLTAALLSEAGIKVEIIDHQERTTARSYACALHSSSLDLLDKLGLTADLLARGKRVHRVAFYEGENRQAVINLSELGDQFPFLLVLPQSELEEILEQKLCQKRDIKVRWNHRFDDVKFEDDAVVATVEKLGGTAMGYIVPHWETVVQKRFNIRAQFLVGADGHNSLVRQRLGINYGCLADAQAFVACEFAADSQNDEDEARVVLEDGTTNVLWPLPLNAQRWTFQLIHSDPPGDFPEKDRRASAMEKVLNEQIRGGLQRLIRHRAPWFSANVDGIAWCKQVSFEHRLADQFQKNRCLLAGDSAHQTCPVGVQSMNAGLREAEGLAGLLQKVLREEAPLDLLAGYNREWQAEWRQLLGLTGGLHARGGTSPWVQGRLDKILPCLPASGENLKRMVNHLELDLQ